MVMTAADHKYTGKRSHSLRSRPSLPVANRDMFARIRETFLSAPFAADIAALVTHGSALYYPLRDRSFSDVDLELVLRHRTPQAYEALRQIVASFDARLECNLRFSEDIDDLNRYIRLRGYRLFLSYAYGNGVSLVGRNPYKVLAESLPDDLVRHSILMTLQISLKDVRQSYIAGAEAHVVNKHIALTLEDACLLVGALDYRRLGTREILKHEEKACVPLALRTFRLRRACGARQFFSLHDVKSMGFGARILPPRARAGLRRTLSVPVV